MELPYKSLQLGRRARLFSGGSIVCFYAAADVNFSVDLFFNGQAYLVELDPLHSPFQLVVGPIEAYMSVPNVGQAVIRVCQHAH